MNTPAKPTSARIPHRLGAALSVAYILLAAIVYALIASQPPDDGLEWLPLIWLAMPWFKLGQFFFIPGILINGIFLYACGVLIQLAWRARTRSSAN